MTDRQDGSDRNEGGTLRRRTGRRMVRKTKQKMLKAAKENEE